MTIAKSVPSLEMCDPPEQFNVDFFFNNGLLYTKDGEVYFYEVGQTEAAGKTEGSSMPLATTLEWKKELEGVRVDVQEIKTEIFSLTSTVLGLKESLGVHTDKMIEALTFMIKMVNFVDQRTARPPQGLPLGTTPQKSTPTSPVTMPVNKRNEPTPSTANESTVPSAKKQKGGEENTTTTNTLAMKEIPRPRQPKARNEATIPQPPRGAPQKPCLGPETEFIRFPRVTK